MQQKESRGLPGGPNEMFTYTTGVFSTEGFRMDSPDVNNYQNIIPSGSITMKERDGSPLRKGPIHGIDNLGNEQVMYPGYNYEFPGTEVTETLMAKMGGALLDKTIECGNCGWEWKAADGGSDVMDCHKCGGKGLIKAQQGQEIKPPLGGGKYYTTDNKVVDWGTPEYEAAYNRGEVLSDKGVRSEVTLDGGKLDDVVIKNNYKRGFWGKYRDKIIDENKDAGLLGAIAGVPISAVTSLPQLAATYGITGKMERPSEAMDIKNPYLAMGVDAVADPTNLVGAGLLSKTSLIAPEIKQGIKVLGNYGNDVIQTSKAAGKIKLPTYANAYRWQADVVPESLVNWGKSLTPEQQSLTGSWYTENVEQLPFYMRTRPGSGNVNVSRLSNTKIDHLRETMSDAAKGMSGKAESVAASNTSMPGELILPEASRSNLKKFKFDVNPSEYSIPDESIKNPQYRNAVIDENTTDIIKPMLEAQYQPIMGIPRKYFPFAEGGETIPPTQYVVKKGDTLGKIAAANNTSIASIMRNNENIADPNVISVNQKINLATQSAGAPKEEVYRDWDTIRNKKDEINKLSDEQKIIRYYNDKPEEKYLILDKKNAVMKLYTGGNFTKSYEVGVGQNPGDAQTVTKVKDGKTDWTGGNKSTGAGIYTISNIDPASKEYYGLPAFNLKNENGIEVATTIHGTPTSRRSKFSNGTVIDNRMSNGCINGKCEDLKDLYNELEMDAKVYILPEDTGNNFQIIDGKPALKVSAQNRQKYNSYVDQKGVTQKGQGANQTTNTLVYKPIKAFINEKKFKEDVFQWNDFNDEKEYTSTTKPFIVGLTTNKKDVMKAAKISSDVYNELAKMAFGIYGAESNFGDTHTAVGNLARGANKFLDPKSASSPDYKSKATTYGADENYRSVGLTQLKFQHTPWVDGKVLKYDKNGKATYNGKTYKGTANNPVVVNELSPTEKAALKAVGITSNQDFLDPEKAAIGTVTLLGIRYNEQLNNKQKQDVWKYLPSKWNTRENYSSRVKNNSSYLSFKQLDKKQDGGEKEDTSWTAYLNPANWGTSRYDDAGTFKEAFRAARVEGDSDFLWKGDRYSTELKKNVAPAKPKGITPEILIRQAYRESAFNPKAVSPAGYKGLGQIGDDIIKDYKKANNIAGNVDPFNMKQNSEVQKYSMNELYNSSFINKPGQSEQVRLAKTLAAYNWGRTNVSNLLNDLKEDGVDIYNSLDWISKLPDEPKKYINDILLQKNTTFNTDFSKALGNQKNMQIKRLYGFRDGGESKPGPLMIAYNRLPAEKKMGGAIDYKQVGGEKKYSEQDGRLVVTTKKVDTADGPRYYQAKSPDYNFSRELVDTRSRTRVADSIPKANLDPRIIESLNKKQFGGQLNSTNITMYKDYIKGNIGNEEQAVKNYDKLNRIYYNKAKELGMTAANYIMTYVVDNS